MPQNNIEKLKSYLLDRSQINDPGEVCYILRLVYLILEEIALVDKKEEERSEFETLKYYRDWPSHIKKSRTAKGKLTDFLKVLTRPHEILANVYKTKQLVEEQIDLINFPGFRSSLVYYCSNLGIKNFEDDYFWESFSSIFRIEIAGHVVDHGGLPEYQIFSDREDVLSHGIDFNNGDEKLKIAFSKQNKEDKKSGRQYFMMTSEFSGKDIGVNLKKE